MLDNTARGALAIAKLVAVDKKKHVRIKHARESASQSAQDTSQLGRRAGHK